MTSAALDRLTSEHIRAWSQDREFFVWACWAALAGELDPDSAEFQRRYALAIRRRNQHHRSARRRR
jgi:hypothetical protein